MYAEHLNYLMKHTEMCFHINNISFSLYLDTNKIKIVLIKTNYQNKQYK